MKKKAAGLLCSLVLALCWVAIPTSAQTIFTDLGPPGNVYNSSTGWTVSGSGSGVGQSFDNADLFTAGATGAVSQIDLAIAYIGSPQTFDASMWTDNAGLPGSQVAGASWTGLSTSTIFGNCCGLVTVSGISGVDLVSGQSYFMIITPVSEGDTSWTPWNWNNQGATSPDLYSNDGGSTWTNQGPQPTAAFDIVGAPEPNSALLTGMGLLALAGWFGLARKKFGPSEG